MRSKRQRQNAVIWAVWALRNEKSAGIDIKGSSKDDDDLWQDTKSDGACGNCWNQDQVDEKIVGLRYGEAP
jgi:hypothetical protein